MTQAKAKEIITEYVFSDYKLEALYPIVDEKIPDADERDRKLYAEAFLNDALQKAVIALKEKHIFAYENSSGDKGVIIAENKETAEALFKAKYPKRRILTESDDCDEYTNNGAYLYEAGDVENNKLFDTFPG